MKFASICHMNHTFIILHIMALKNILFIINKFKDIDIKAYQNMIH